jgi:hypothetical protein
MSSFDQMVENAIQDAIKRGKFDNLSNKGKPLDLNPYFETPQDVRVIYTALKNSGLLPTEVELLKEIEGLQELLKSCQDAEQRESYQKQLDEKQLAFALAMEHLKTNRKHTGRLPALPSDSQ